MAVGRSVKEALVANEGIPTRRIEVIPNGIDTDRFVASPAVRAQARAELGIARRLPRVDGRAARPDQATTRPRFGRARAAAVIPNLRLVLVGDGPESPGD